MLRRDIRYQAAILRDDHVLLLHIVEPDGTTFWVAPGGGREAEETAEHVCREILEETSLTVEVEQFLFAEPEVPRETYDFRHTTSAGPTAEPPRSVSIRRATRPSGAWGRFDLRARPVGPR